MVTISLCMIVRDEEDVLGRCLESVRDLVDEIIIVPESNDDSVIAYEVSGIEVGDRLLPDESTKMEVKIYYNDKVDSDVKYYNDNLKIVINYAQD